MNQFETEAMLSTHYQDHNADAIIPPIYLSTNFERAPDGTYPKGYGYIRENTPNRAHLEDCLKVLEHGELALAFSSGQAATAAIFQSLGPGDHIILPDQVYYGTPGLLTEIYASWGLSYSQVDMSDLAAVRSAINERTRLIWMETPSNPLLKIVDIAAIAEIAKEKGLLSICDNTWATPVLQQPLSLGCDVVMHATTKYMGGHSDVLGGALVFGKADAYALKIQRIQRLMGMVPAPFDCWLVIRGIKTLAMRVKAQTQHAKALVEFLQTHPRVEKVHYPGLKTHLGHEIALRQMSDFGALLSVQIQGEREEAFEVVNKLKIFRRATSLGGVESLIEHRKSVEGPLSPSPENLLRISAGLENPVDLINDLSQALS